MHRSILALVVSSFAFFGMTLASSPSTAIAQPAPASSFTGTAIVSYAQLPWYYLPTSLAPYAGNYQLLVHFAVRDRQHFRIDTETLSPAIESSTSTIVVRGSSILSYDKRTETAGHTTFGLSPRLGAFSMSTGYLLSRFLTGASFVPGGPLPPSAHSVKEFARQIREALSIRYPPEFPGSYARIVSRQTMLGHNVDVLQYGPLKTTDTVTGCTFRHPGHCVHHYLSHGSMRLWIDHTHLFILQARQQTVADLHALDMLAGNAAFRVTAIAYGVGPSAGEMAFVPPVPVKQTENGSPLSSGEDTSSGGPIQLPPGFINLPMPTESSSLSTDEGVTKYLNGPVHQTTGVDFLYSDGRHVTVYTHPGDRYGTGLYIKGAYLYGEERRQVHGLPATLQIGTPRTVGTCSVWTGSDTSRQHWLATARGSVSILIVSNALTKKQLIAYARRSMCT